MKMKRTEKLAIVVLDMQDQMLQKLMEAYNEKSSTQEQGEVQQTQNIH